MEIARNRHSLGMVIEGGTDTSQQEARIINILPGGAAFETGGLRVGQIIKEVEGISLKGTFINMMEGGRRSTSLRTFFDFLLHY